MKQATASTVRGRWGCAFTLIDFARNKNYGVITNVKLTRIAWGVWHLQFNVKVKDVSKIKGDVHVTFS